MSDIISLGTGKMSTFGGPADEGVGPHEGLALVGPTDLGIWWWSCLFLPEQPAGTTGLARRLNPRAFYLAMRWNYADAHRTDMPLTSRELLRNTVVKLTNPANGLHIFARPVDFGPGDGSIIDGQSTPNTGRIADLSPGAATTLGMRTDDLVRCEVAG